jgi:choline dehydrogenase-like flavoprotein
MIRSGRELTADLALSCDLAVVGTGAGGGMLIADAARAGLSVIAVEEGPHRTARDFNQREREMISALFQDQGARATRDGAVAVLQGRGVGGSTVHNTNLCKRIPDPILEHWAADRGLTSWRPSEIAADFAAVEERLHVSAIEPERVNRNNDALLRGMQALGWRGGILSHNRRGCVGSGFCELGCAFDAKENVLKVLLPEAIAHGATVWAECRAERVTVAGGRASGVEARVFADGKPGPRISLRARAVALAGSAVGSAALALASGLPDPGKLVGRNLHLHPGAAVAGLFDQPIEGWMGIPQSVECVEHIDWQPGSPRRVWIVPAFAHPIGFAAMLPGFGAAHMQKLRKYRYFAVLVAMLHDESAGRVTASAAGRPLIEYALGEPDARALAGGLSACARLLLAAGAREVLAPGGPVRTDAEALALAARPVRPFDPPLTAAHPMSTLPMAADPRRGVTDGDGRWHGLPGLYVADGSLFPTSIGGPPQIPIYTAGRRVARTILHDLNDAVSPR